jgi:hypothetical protein
MTIIIKVIVGHPEGIKEAAESLIGLLGILLIDGNIVPQLVVVATDVKCDFVSGLTVAEDLIRNITDSYAMVALSNRRKTSFGVLTRVINEFAHIM